MPYSISEALTGSQIANNSLANANRDLDNLNKTIGTISSIAYKFDIFLQGLETKKKVEALNGLKFYNTLAQREFENNFALAQAEDNQNRFNMNYELAKNAQEFNQNIAQQNIAYRDKVYKDSKERYDLAVKKQEEAQQTAKTNAENQKLATQKYNQLYSDYEKQLMATKDPNERARILAEMDKLAREANANGVKIFNPIRGNAKYGLPTSKSGSKSTASLGSFKIDKNTSMTKLFNAIKGYKGKDLTAIVQEIYPRLSKAQKDALISIANNNGYKHISTAFNNIGKTSTYDTKYDATINRVVNKSYEKYINESGYIGDKLNWIAEKAGFDVNEPDFKKKVTDKIRTKIKNDFRDGRVYNGVSETQIKLNALDHSNSTLVGQNIATGVHYDVDTLEDFINAIKKAGFKTFKTPTNRVQFKRNIDKYLKDIANEKHLFGKVAKASAKELMKAEMTGNMLPGRITVNIDGKQVALPKSVYEKIGNYYLSIDVLGAYNTKNN
jgi:hypothetical protein